MKYDVAIIGAGPAGLMAAGRAAELGARVVVIEKNAKPGAKLLLTGGGRCNITNRISEPRKLAEAFGPEGKFLLSAFSKFGADSAIGFFEARGVKTKAEDHGRIFPQSDRAQDVLSALLDYAQGQGAEIRTRSEAKEAVLEKGRISKLVLLNGEEILADEFILATGGKSYPATGSSGDGYLWLKKMGHSSADAYPALSPVYVKEKFLAELQGLSLKEAEVNLYCQDKKIISKSGELLFTRNGLSGPLALDLSRSIARQLPRKCALKIDFLPGMKPEQANETLSGILRENSNKAVGNSLGRLLPPKLITIILRQCKIDGGKKSHSITKEERKSLAALLKNFVLEVDAIGGYEQAMVTSGGVNLKEVEQKTLRSKLVANLYLAGEVLGIDGPTGGYNLQVCWSSGYLAGESAAYNA